MFQAQVVLDVSVPKVGGTINDEPAVRIRPSSMTARSGADSIISPALPSYLFKSRHVIE